MLRCKRIAMAMYHLHARFVQRSQGQSSVASAMYRAGERGQDQFSGKLYDFTHKTHITHKEILLPDMLPDRLGDRCTLWNTVELGLNHKNGQPAFEVEVALPRELTHEQRVELARQFAQREFVDKGMIVDMCMHMDTASDGGEHPHCHFLVPTRRWSEEGRMTKAARDLQDNPKLLQKVYALEEAGQLDDALLTARGTNLARWRENWAIDTNDFLERYEHEDRVDHRTLAAQQIEREAKPYIGFAFYREVDGLKGWLAERVEAFKAIDWRNDMRDQFERIRETRRDLQADFIAHAREYAPKLFPELQHELPEQGIEHER